MDGLEDKGARDAERARLDYPCGDRPEPRAVKEVAPGVLWVSMPLPFSLKWINLWLIDDGPGWTLVDTGLGLEESRQHWRAIFADHLGGRAITRIICTHMHPDHIGLAGWISRKFDARLWMSRLEYITARMLVADTGREAPEDAMRFYRAAGWGEAQITEYRERFGMFGKAVSTMPDSFRRVVDGEAVRIGADDWRVVMGSGHSPEHVCLWNESKKLFISGDQVLPRISSNVSVFPTEPDADPLADWIASCESLRVRVPDDVLVLPAHNEPFRGLHARLEALVAGHERSLARLEKRISDGPKRAVDVFVALFGREVGEGVFGMATGEALAHLRCLVGRGRAVRRLGADGVAYYEPA